MKNFTQTAAVLLKDESGQGLIEYALIAGLIGVVAIVALTSVGGKISNLFTNISNSLPSGS
jgi:pilus assembly protein Flp/PilA